MSAVQIVLALIALERAAEALLVRRNTRQLGRRGTREAGRQLNALLIGLQAVLPVALWVALPTQQALNWPLLWAFLAVFGLRIALVSGLGPVWTARLLADPDAPLAAGLSYRHLRHIPYLLVLAETALLPLACGVEQVAAAFCLVLATLITARIRAEDAALASRRRVLAHLAGWRLRGSNPSLGYNRMASAAPARIRRFANAGDSPLNPAAAPHS